ncbi:hypothetical protein [Euryhalocaulis caribicus]|uniref:hypothetical protein n=1 Tax=Euryhalocaulis caribicus TaxID=1161401 RepID=UPI001268443A|nr:hypothetical protein [Euryhalocaulis caribicus]
MMLNPSKWSVNKKIMVAMAAAIPTVLLLCTYMIAGACWASPVCAVDPVTVWKLVAVITPLFAISGALSLLMADDS